MLECIRAILKWDIVDGIAKLNLCKSLTFGDTVDFMRGSEKYTFLMDRKDGFIGSTCHVINKLILRDNDEWISSQIYHRVGLAAAHDVHVTYAIRIKDSVIEVIPENQANVSHENIEISAHWFYGLKHMN